MKKLLFGLVTALLICVIYAGYLLFSKPNAERDLESANAITEKADAEIRGASEVVRDIVSSYDLRTKNGDSISVEDIFIEADDGTYIPRESVIVELDNDSIATVVNGVIDNGITEEMAEYGRVLLESDAIRRRGMEYALSQGISLDSLLSDE